MPCLPEPAVAERDVWRAAPALLQQARRQHLEPCGGRRARRALFGAADPDESRRFVKEELAAIRDADQRKYNFNFDTMTPLPGGAWEWEVARPGEVAQAYEFGRLQGAACRAARQLDFDSPPPSEPSGTEPRRPEPAPAEPASGDEAGPEPAPTATAPPAATRQTTITDFLRSRKRPSAFTPCGDSAAKRPLTASESTRPPSTSTSSAESRT